jgi:hypothetical protein
VAAPDEIHWRMETAYAPYLSILSLTFIVPKHLLVPRHRDAMGRAARNGTIVAVT